LTGRRVESMIDPVPALRWLVLALAITAVIVGPARAAPVVVVAFRSGEPPPPVRATRDALAAAARRGRVAWLDGTTVPPASRAEAAALLRAGIEAYDALRFDAAAEQLDRAAADAAAHGAAGLTPSALSDLFLYRGLARQQRGDEAGGWDDLVAAAVVDPTRALDPVRFPPRAIEAFERARAALATRSRAVLRVQAATTCAVRIDGLERRQAELVAGAHYVRARCPDRVDWGERVVVDAPTQVIASGAPLTAISDEDLLVQARLLGGDAVIVDATAGAPPLVTARRISADGRERARASATAGTPAAAALLDELLAAPRPARSRWRSSPWVWAGAGALAASAVLVPLLLFGDDPELDATVRPSGLPW
jgi:hypothetical protein